MLINLIHLNVKKSKIVVGINMTNLYKCIKSINNSDILTLFIDSEDTSRLGIQIENAELNELHVYKANMMDLDEDPLDVPPTSFDTKISIPSNQFHKLCRDMNNNSDTIEIQNIGKTIIVKGNGDIEQNSTLGESINGLKVEREEGNNKIIQGKYELKHLVMFTKCTSLCTTVDIFMKNDYPLVIRYTVASLGYVILCLAPMMDSI